MGTVLAVLGVLAVLFVAALVATRGGELLVDAPRDRPDPGLPADGPVRADDLERVRFGMALRGYRMAEVDDLLDRLAAELRERDARLAAMQGADPAEPPERDAGPVDEPDLDRRPGVDPLPDVTLRPGADPPAPVPFPEPVHTDRPRAVPPADTPGVPDTPGPADTSGTSEPGRHPAATLFGCLRRLPQPPAPDCIGADST